MSIEALVPRPERGVIHHAARPYGRSECGAPLASFGPQDGPVDLLIIASMHGDESESTVVLSEALRGVPESAVVSPVVLAVNPDGLARGTRCNARGVDLNRNWPTTNWSSDTVYYRPHGKAAHDTCLSPGESPGSEPETRCLQALVEKLQPRAIISLHTALGCIDDPRDSGLAHWISGQVGLPVVPDVGYPTPGSFGTWCAERGTLILTWELPAESVVQVLASHVPVLRRLIIGDYPAGCI